MRSALLAVCLGAAVFVPVSGSNPLLTITAADPNTLATTIVGPGVTLIGAPVFTGATEQAGTFTSFTTGPWTNPVTKASGVVSLAHGVIFSSGVAAQANALFDGGADSSIGGPGDPDLTAIAGAPTFDATTLTFQFIPNATAISFRFVFASTEYPDFVGSPFFDAIAIKVNGVNVAVIPGTATPVNVNTINVGGPYPPPAGTPPSRPDLFTNYSATGVTPFNYGGATVILAANALVNPGVANTIKIAVGDTSDPALDSAIFLEAASLTACTFAVAPSAKEVTGDAGGGRTTVTTAPGCTWTPTSNVPWLTPSPAGQRAGSGTLDFTYAANPDPVARTGRITITPDTFLDVTQFPSAVAATLAGGTTPAVSGNARFVAFATAGALIPTDTNNASDIYVIDRANPDAATNKARVSVGGQQQQGNAGSFRPEISDDGRFVAFESDASNFAPDDTNGVRDVFLRDRDADGDGVFDEPGGVTTRLVSRGTPYPLAGGGVGEGPPGRGPSGRPAISADGSLIAFASEADNLVFGDTNNVRDVFVHVRADRKVYRVSRTGTGPQAAGASDRPALSGNGRLIAFESAAVLTSDDSDASADIYVFDWTASATPATGITTLRSLPAPGASGVGANTDAAISADGSLVAFASAAQMVAADGNAGIDIYVRSAVSTTLVSRNISGAAVGGSGSPAVSGDGGSIAFSTTAGLSPFDTNGVDDVYALNLAGGQMRLVSAGASGAGTDRSFDPSISADGGTIVFATLAVLPSLGTEGRPMTMTSLEPAEAGIALSTPLPSVTGITGVVAPDRGPALQQTAVQIRGRNLYGINGVRFGAALGIGAGVSNGGTVVETTAPAQPAGTVTVRVGNLVSTGIDVGSFTYDAQPPCKYSLSAPDTSLDAAGQTTTLTVDTTPDTGCGWNLARNAEWLTIQPESGTGDGSVTVTAPSNPNPPERSATIDVSSQSVTYTQAGSGCTDLIKPASRAREVSPGAGTDDGIEIETSPGCNWSASADVTWLHPPPPGTGSATVLYSIDPNPGATARQGTLTVQGPAMRADIVVTQLAPPPPAGCSFAASPSPLSLGVEGGMRALTITAPAGCAWNARSDASWIALNGPTSGTGNGNLLLIAAPNEGTTREGIVTLNINVPPPDAPTVKVVELGLKGGLPFGVVDTPADNATSLRGSIPLTGWVLDDKSGVLVEIFAEEQAAGASAFFVGNAVRVRGARPDVQGVYPSSAESDQAGWGYLLLSNQLANLRNGTRIGSGNGTFKLNFRARDTDGNVTSLGERVVTFDNAAATAPFGAIDTPDQGAETSGASFAQFGWALTPAPKTIPADGSTISVLIDGANIGSPAYGLARTDIADLFPGLSNSAGPVGVLEVNTLALVNGVHTIAWIVTDDSGAASGVGSRFFRVNNPGAITPASTTALSSRDAIDALPVSSAGTHHVMVHALDIVRLALDGATDGYVVNGGTLENLPIGSMFDARSGTFAWQLGPGFAGVYTLVFVRDAGGVRERIPVRIVVSPETGEMPAEPPLTVDSVTAAIGRLRLAGTTLSGEARELREVTVYACPRGEVAPILAGKTTVAAPVTHVAEAQGGQFGRSPFSVTLESLTPGTYDLLVVARSAVSQALDASTWVRGVTLQ